MTHSSIPWQIKHDWNAEGRTTIIANVEGDTDAGGATSYTYDTIARCSDAFEEYLPNAAANAALIINRVNTYDALVEALREARDALNFHYTEWNGEPEDAGMLQLARSKCNAALALAKGE